MPGGARQRRRYTVRGYGDEQGGCVPDVVVEQLDTLESVLTTFSTYKTICYPNLAQWGMPELLERTVGTQPQWTQMKDAVLEEGRKALYRLTQHYFVHSHFANAPVYEVVPDTVVVDRKHPAAMLGLYDDPDGTTRDYLKPVPTSGCALGY